MFCSNLMLFVAVACAICFVKGCPMGIDRGLDNSTVRQATANQDNLHLWPNGIVPYKISSLYSAENRAIILEGIAEFAKYTCIQFVPRRTERDYIIFTEHSSGSCWTGKWMQQQLEVGRLGGVQYVSLIVSLGCLKKFNVMHELMHSLGFWHEQQRDDRDQYVKVFIDNIVENQREVSYEKRSTAAGVATNLDTPYDYNSIMHYHPYSATIDPTKPTMAAIDGCSQFGNENQFSKVDVLRINKLYNCPTPYKSPPPKVTYGSDSNPSCQSWASLGECTRNPGYMTVHCKQSCGINQSSSSNCPSCKDDIVFCPSWAAAGYCTYSDYMSYMYSNCRKSCEIC